MKDAILDIMTALIIGLSLTFLILHGLDALFY